MTLKALAIESSVQAPAAQNRSLAGIRSLRSRRAARGGARQAVAENAAPRSGHPADALSGAPVSAELAPGCQVRRLGPDDAAAFQALRLEGLATDPCAFAASHDEEAGHSLIEVAARLERQPVFGAVAEGVLLAVAGFADAGGCQEAAQGAALGRVRARRRRAVGDSAAPSWPG